jgi:hypothetical protein
MAATSSGDGMSSASTEPRPAGGAGLVTLNGYKMIDIAYNRGTAPQRLVTNPRCS